MDRRDNEEHSRREQNSARLLKLHPAMRPKIVTVLHKQELYGWKPLIDVSVFRTAAEQQKMVERGVSHVRYSFHNVSDKNGKPQSLAVDITDQRYGWESPRKFWLQLGAAYTDVGLHWGGFFGLKNRTQALRDRLKARDWESPDIALGWDLAHGEWIGISLTAARLGARPKLSA